MKHVNAVKCDVTKSLPVFIVICNPGDLHLKTLLDTGSDEDLISEEIVTKHKLPVMNARRTFVDFVGMPFQANQSVKLTVHINNKIIPVTFWLFKSLSFELLIGYKTLHKFGIALTNTETMSRVMTSVSNDVNNRIESVNDIELHFPVLLRPFRERQQDYIITFKVDDNIPLIQRKPYRLTPIKEDFARRKVQQMLDDGFVELTDSPFASPSIVVNKKDDPDGTTGLMRLCTDFRDLNQYVTQDPYPLPLIDHLIMRAGGAKFFSRIDLKESFYQLPLTPESRMYSAFVTPGYHVQYTCLCFGYRNSPQIFQKFMTAHVLRELLSLIHI